MMPDFDDERIVIHARDLADGQGIRLEARDFDADSIAIEVWFGVGGLLKTIVVRREDAQRLRDWIGIA